jgi:uncharacterized membrane protein (DUF485 family)
METDMESLTDTTARIIATHPRFRALERARARVRWGLSGLTVAVFFGFVLMISFAKGFLATKVGDGLMPLGFYLAIGMLLFVVLVTGFYVQRASSLFGRMTDELVKEIGL